MSAAAPARTNCVEDLLGPQPLVVVFLFVAGGIAVDRWRAISFEAWLLCAVAGWLVWLICSYRRDERWAAVWLLSAVLCCGAAWHHWHWSLFPATEIGIFADEHGDPVCLEATVADEPRRRAAPGYDPLRSIPVGERTEVDLQIRAIRDGRNWRVVSGQSSLFVAGHLLGVHAGDQVQVFGQMVLTPRPRNPGEYDRSIQTRADRIHTFVYSDSPACIRIQQHRGTFGLRGWMSRWRVAGVKVLTRHLNEAQSQLAAALLLGARDRLEDEPVEAFFTTGMIHVLVVSGMHVVILAGCLFFLLRLGFVARRPALLCIIGAVVFYTLLTGSQPPAMRAATLIGIYCLAKYAGRRAVNGNSLAASALLVLAMNPAELFRTGPQLSFLAVLVLNWIASWRKPVLPVDPLDRLIYNTRPAPQRGWLQIRGKLFELFTTTSLVWGLITPLTMYSFHLFSPVSLLLGPVLWLPVLGATVSGFSLLVVGAIFPLLAAPLAWVCGLCLDSLQAGVDWGQSLPGSYAWTAGPSLWWVIGFYTGCGLMWAFPQLLPRNRWRISLLAVWLSCGFLPALLRPQTEELRLTYISVEHGLSVLVEMPSGQTMLYDCGRIGSPHVPARSIAATLWSRGIAHLDAVVISHADADHYNALPELLKRFSVGAVYVSPLMFERKTPALDTLKERIEEAGVPIREIWAGDRLKLNDKRANSALPGGENAWPRLEVLHPPRQGVLGSDNANSVVLEIMYAGRRILLTGDLESPGLNLVMSELPLPTDILLAPHHGSARSDPPGFAAWSTPRWLVISGGEETGQQLVRAAYEKVGAEVLHTSKQGAITATIRKSGEVEIRTFRQASK
jgi:competence protein ComEC